MIETVRIKLTEVVEGAIKRFSGSGREGESFKAREYLQHYGFTSRPKPEAEGLALVQDGIVYLFASDDRRYRLAIEEGEVALYSDEGDHIRFMRDKQLKVHTGRKLLAEALEEAELTTKVAKVVASTSITASAPTITYTANSEFKVDSPAIKLGTNVKALVNSDLLNWLNTHSHSALSTPPSTPASAAIYCTTKVKGE